jgi:hypothetical protein
VRAQPNRILGSPLFSRSDRLTAFLTFIVEETLSGRADPLKEHTVAIEVYGKGADFSAAADPIVRVDARRLRDRLREYYASAPHDALLISVPKGSYTPEFAIAGAAPAADRDAVEQAPAVIGESRSTRLSRLWLAAAALVLIAIAGWLAIRATGRSELPPVR